MPLLKFLLFLDISISGLNVYQLLLLISFVVFIIVTYVESLQQVTFISANRKIMQITCTIIFFVTLFISLYKEYIGIPQATNNSPIDSTNTDSLNKSSVSGSGSNSTRNELEKPLDSISNNNNPEFINYEQDTLRIALNCPYVWEKYKHTLSNLKAFELANSQKQQKPLIDGINQCKIELETLKKECP